MAVAPKLIPPMLAIPGELPSPSEDERWAYEMKWDGVRAVGYADGHGVRLMSRNDLDMSRSYPEVAEAAALPGSLAGVKVVVDGELVALDRHGRSSFSRLQERMHVKDAATVRRLMASVPVIYMVFDVLVVDGTSLLKEPYPRRREALQSLGLDDAADGLSWKVPPSFTGGGQDAMTASRENGFEGVVAKRLGSIYQPGRRSPDWRKVKHVRMQEVVVAGWKPGKGRRTGTIGSLVLGINGGIDGDEGLVFAGGVGTGFTEAMLRDLHRRLTALERATPPFAQAPPRSEVRGVRWVRPQLVGEVTFTEWTPDGRLRHPSWRGLRPDKKPSDVRKE